MHPFFFEIACQTGFMSITSCGKILWIAFKNKTSTPKIWSNVVGVPQSCILPPDVFLPQN